MRFPCPSCQQPLLSQPNLIGQAATCPYCQAKFTVPSFSEIEAAGTAPQNTLPEAPPKPRGTGEQLIAIGLGIGFTICALILLFPIKGTYFGDLFLDRGWVPFGLLFLMGWALGILFVKMKKLKAERRALLMDGLPTTIARNNPQRQRDPLSRTPRQTPRQPHSHHHDHETPPRS